MSQSTLFMLLLLAIGIIGRNNSLTIAVIVLLVIQYSGLGKFLYPYIQQKGINWGVTIIMIAVLIPIVTGEIGFKQLTEAFRSAYAWIAMISGIAVALIAANGIDLLKTDPHITTALVMGTILAVALFQGVAVGPLIGAGIAYFAIKVVEFFSSF